MLDIRPFDLREIIEDLGELFAPQAHQKDLELNCALPPGAPFNLQGDAGRLRQILVNLIGNAIKFTERGEVTVRVAAAEASSTETTLRIEVQDTGIGVPPEARADL